MSAAGKAQARTWNMVSLGGLVAVFLVVGVFFVHLTDFMPEPLNPFIAGVMVLAIVWGLYAWFTGDLGIWNAVRGEDGRSSTSLFQFFLWTGVVLFGYVALAAARIAQGTDALPAVPANVLIALGISTVTTTGAALIRANQDGPRTGTAEPTGDLAKPIFCGDDGKPDLGKIQLVAWTFVALAVYIVTLMGQINLWTEKNADGSYKYTTLCESDTDKDCLPDTMPDIDATLMILTGLTSGAYLGKKLVTSSGQNADGTEVSATTPILSSIDTALVQVGLDTFTVVGSGFGEDATAGSVLLDGSVLQTTPVAWTATSITVRPPAQRPNGKAWRFGTPVEVQVAIGGRSAPVPLNVTLEQ